MYRVFSGPTDAVSGLYWIYGGSWPGAPGAQGVKIYCDMETNGGGWVLALNINPSDGHIHGYDGGNWETMSPWPGSSEDTALLQDYKSVAVYNRPFNEIMVANHNDLTVNAFKSWRFTTERSLYSAFRSGTTTGAQEQTGTCANCAIPVHCPFMSLTGALKFSDTGGNDGVRLGV